MGSKKLKESGVRGERKKKIEWYYSNDSRRDDLRIVQ